MIELTADGVCYSLKNRRQPITVTARGTGKKRIIFILNAEARAAMKGFITEFSNQWSGRPPLDGDLTMELDLFYPNRRHDGSDEMVKDALQAAKVISNDRQIHRVLYQKFLDKDRPRVVVRLIAMDRSAGCGKGIRLGEGGNNDPRYY